MKLLQTQTLRGPNYWSVSCSKLIVVLLDLEAVADGPFDIIPGFYEGLLRILPSLKERISAIEHQGKFGSGELKSSLMGHILKFVALELQILGDMPVEFGCICETASPGTYQVAIEYQNEEAGRYATRAALRLCQSIIETGDYPEYELRKDLEDLQNLRAEAAQGASTDALLQEAEARGIPWMHLETCDLFQFGYGKHQKRVQAALTSRSNVLGVELACDKERTKEILTRMGAPVPLGKVVYAFRELEDAINDLGGYPIVIKPLNGNQGRGITIDIRSWRQAELAYDRAKDISDGVIVEHFYQGRDHRILVIDHKVIAVAERVPAHVVGNGRDTVAALIEQENQDIRRGEGHDTSLTHIKLDIATDEMLSRQGFTLDTVLQPDQVCYLRANANLSTGGTAIDRTDEIHPDTVWLAERASQIIDLDIVGIDVITTDITQPLKDVDGVIVEVNAAPGLRMHMAPSQGVARNVAAPILDMLFPEAAPTQIPVVAVAESGTETLTPLIAHIFSQVHAAVGCTTTAGVYIGNHQIKTGDATNARNAQLILQDPMVDLAVLEAARSSILRSGLAFQHCDVGVVLNVVADHPGNICTLDHRAKALSVIAGAVHADGYAVLNADDQRVAAMAGQVQGQVAYFSVDPKNSVVRSHVQRGGIAALYDQGYLSIVQQDQVQRIEKVAHLPLTVCGCETASIASALAACLVAHVQGMTVEQIRSALHTYRSSEQQSPEQMDWPSFVDEQGQFSLLQLYLDSKRAVPRTEQLPQLERLPVMCDRNRSAIVFPRLNTASQLFCMNALNAKQLFQLGEPAQRSGFTFWGTLGPSSHDLEPQGANAESSLDASSHIERQPKELDLVTTYGNSDPQNDPTKLWVEFENRLKPQNVLQNYTPHVSTVAVAPEIKAVAPAVPEAGESLKIPQTNPGGWVAQATPTQIETTQLKVAEAIVERSHKQLTAFAQAVKQYGFKTWAKRQAPAAKQVAITAAQNVGEQVLEKGMMLGAIAFVLGRRVAKAALKTGKALVEIIWEELGPSTKSVDPTILDPALKEMIVLLGKDGRFEGEVFTFQQTNGGVNVHLKNGTPVYANGKPNPHVKDCFIRHLSQLPERVARVKADVRQQLTAQDYQKRLIGA
jgi:cyanophycin synthetase